MGNELFKELIKKRVRKRQTEFWDSKSGRPYSELNKIEDKSKEVFKCDGGDIEKVIERDDNVMLC